MPDSPRSAPHRDTVYRESVKQAWREEDQAQRDARLNYVTTLGSVHQTSEAAQAAAVLTYQQARAEASRIEQDARAALRVDFHKQQASTFATETAGWLTSAPTPWHKQLASQADAESTYRAVEQDASLLQQQAEHAARENYLDDRETARVTLRTDRAAASAAEAFTEQQNLENGHEYGDEYYDDHDPYQNVTVDLPTGLNYDNSRDPESVSHTLDDDPFSGQFSLGGTFGSQIGGGPDGTDEYGTYFSEYTPGCHACIAIAGQACCRGDSLHSPGRPMNSWRKPCRLFDEFRHRTSSLAQDSGHCRFCSRIIHGGGLTLTCRSPRMT
ncbi:hypothetical protein [Rubinisphaera brasiliensis]|uniref:hypothetical protein n=1 Tax=Rubinisphaera brasiliensis TaxID=119 RepID=UPI0002E49C1C|nr:hypothetical protein [Rubinisphaera brasiliensis]